MRFLDGWFTVYFPQTSISIPSFLAQCVQRRDALDHRALPMTADRHSPNPPSQTVVNLCNLPPWVIGSTEFNDDPRQLRISGVREANRYLFDMLEEIENPHRRGEVLNEYMMVKFHLHEWQEIADKHRKTPRSSYVRFLRGWGVDSNSIEGAVLKSWVQSRFGLRPTYHRDKLLGTNHNDDYQFALDRMKGMARTNAIYSQLDLLYEFCQEELARRLPRENWLTLFRGTFDAGDYDVLQTHQGRRQVVRLNNLSSFTSDRECAWEFGSRVWEVKAPIAKILFFSDLLPNSILRGESEYLLIGGEYRVTEVIY